MRQKTVLLMFVCVFHLSVFGQINADSVLPLREGCCHTPLTIDNYFTISMEASYTPIDFDDFRPLLNDINVDLMNKSDEIASFQIAGNYRRFYAGLSLGLQSLNDYDNDSLNIDFNTTQYGIHLGYQLFNTRHVQFTPKVALKWNRYRLINSAKNYEIPITHYLNERDLDLRFNQLTGFVGCNLSYMFLIRRKYFLSGDFLTIGLFGGYEWKLNDAPWIYSPQNRLIGNGKIDMKHMTIGLNFSSNLVLD